MATVEEILTAQKNGEDAQGDTGGGEDLDEGGSRGSQDVEGQETHEDESQSGETTGEDRGGEDGGSGKGGERDEDQAEEETTPDLTKVLSDIAEKLNAPPKAPEDQPKEFTDEEFQKVADDMGVSVVGVKRINSALMSGLQQLEKKIMEHIDSVVPSPVNPDALVKLSAKYPDIRSHEKGISEFLRRFPRETRSNPQLIEMCYLAAKGKGAPKMVEKARNDRERNRQVIKNSRPHSSNSAASRTRPGTGTKLTPEEKEIAETFGMSESEYAKHKRK